MYVFICSSDIDLSSPVLTNDTPIKQFYKPLGRSIEESATAADFYIHIGIGIKVVIMFILTIIKIIYSRSDFNE